MPRMRCQSTPSSAFPKAGPIADGRPADRRAILGLARDLDRYRHRFVLRPWWTEAAKDSALKPVLLWDDVQLYVASIADDPQVSATLTGRDSPVARLTNMRRGIHRT